MFGHVGAIETLTFVKELYDRNNMSKAKYKT